MRTNEATMSDEQYRLLGFEPGEVEPSFETFVGRIHPDDLEAFHARNKMSLDTGEDFELNFRVTPSDGVTRWIHSRAEVVVEGGKPVISGTRRRIWP